MRGAGTGVVIAKSFIDRNAPATIIIAAMWIRNSALVAVTLSLAACAVNPVTGDRDLILVSGTQELAMGAKNYVPMQQSQGGPYDIDPALTRYVDEVGARVAAASAIAAEIGA